MKVDHIELFVPDRSKAAEWYGNVLGFEVVEPYRDWAAGGGPLMITNDGGDTKLALFEGPPQGSDPARGLRRLAFRVSASDFARFIESSSAWKKDAPLTAQDVYDHNKSLSVYFTDPYGNALEVTTYEYDDAKQALSP